MGGGGLGLLLGRPGRADVVETEHVPLRELAPAQGTPARHVVAGTGVHVPDQAIVAERVLAGAEHAQRRLGGGGEAHGALLGFFGVHVGRPLLQDLEQGLRLLHGDRLPAPAAQQVEDLLRLCVARSRHQGGVAAALPQPHQDLQHAAVVLEDQLGVPGGQERGEHRPRRLEEAVVLLAGEGVQLDGVELHRLGRQQVAQDLLRPAEREALHQEAEPLEAERLALLHGPPQRPRPDGKVGERVQLEELEERKHVRRPVLQGGAGQAPAVGALEGLARLEGLRAVVPDGVRLVEHDPVPLHAEQALVPLPLVAGRVVLALGDGVARDDDVVLLEPLGRPVAVRAVVEEHPQRPAGDVLLALELPVREDRHGAHDERGAAAIRQDEAQRHHRLAQAHVVRQDPPVHRLGRMLLDAVRQAGGGRLREGRRQSRRVGPRRNGRRNRVGGGRPARRSLTC